MEKTTQLLLAAILLLMTTVTSYAAFPVRTKAEHPLSQSASDGGDHLKKHEFLTSVKTYMAAHMAALPGRRHRYDPGSYGQPRGYHRGALPGILSFVFSLLALVCAASIVTFWFFFPLSIAAFVLGIIGSNHRRRHRGFARAGLIISTIEMLVDVLVIAILIVAVAAL